MNRSQLRSAALVSLILLSACGTQVAGLIPDAEISRETQNAVSLGASSAELPAQARSVSVQSNSPIFHASDPATVKLASGKLQFVEFFAYWCAVCKAMAPAIHNLESAFGRDINFVYLDREDPATFALQEQLGYIYQPHFFLLDPNGVILGQWRGYVDSGQLQQALAASLGQ